MTKRAMLLEALASTPADVCRLLRPLTARQLGDPSDQALAEIMLRLIQTEIDFQTTIGANADGIERVFTDEAVVGQVTEPMTALCEQFRLDRDRTLVLLGSLAPAEWQRKVYPLHSTATTVRLYAQTLVESDIKLTSRLVVLVQASRQSTDGEQAA